MPKSNNPSVPQINVFERMFHVWTNFSFLKEVLYAEKDKAVGRSWGFWFLWNTIIAVVVTFGFYFVYAQSWINWVEQDWWGTVADFEMTLEDGEFSTNLPEPYVFFDDDGALVVIDTQEQQYNEESLREMRGGLVITKDKMIAKEQTGEFQSFYFDEFEEDFTFTKADVTAGYYELKPRLMSWVIGIFFFGVWFWLCIWRILTATWWALVFWGIGNMVGIPDWTYPRSYFAVLNFYVIPLTFELILIFVGVGLVSFSTLLAFGLVFGLNFYAFKADDKGEDTVQTS